MAAVYVQCRTTRTRPPPGLMFLYAVCGFVMAILWIAFVSDATVDLLGILGTVLNVPPAVLGLSVLAWGNCLGDLNANTAMTKKGFGEMAVTGCMAGPIFNLCCGLGVPIMLVFLDSEKYDETGGFIDWALWNKRTGELERSNLIPFVMILGTVAVYLAILVNGCKNQYSLSGKFHLPAVGFYGIVLVALISYALWEQNQSDA